MKKSFWTSQFGANGGACRFYVMHNFTVDVAFKFKFTLLVVECSCKTIESRGAIKNSYGISYLTINSLYPVAFFFDGLAYDLLITCVVREK